MVKRLVMEQTGGRREGETPIYRVSPFKIVMSVGTIVLAGWMAWVSLCSIGGMFAKEQVPVLHRRITEDRRHSDAKRDEAVDKITDRIDHVNDVSTQQYQQIMNQLIEIQRDIGGNPGG